MGTTSSIGVGWYLEFDYVVVKCPLFLRLYLGHIDSEYFYRPGHSQLTIDREPYRPNWHFQLIPNLQIILDMHLLSYLRIPSFDYFFFVVLVFVRPLA